MTHLPDCGMAHSGFLATARHGIYGRMKHITVSIDDETYDRAAAMAAERDMSISDRAAIISPEIHPPGKARSARRSSSG
jgi:hypothetical protein